jgi:transcription elongation factor GreA
VALWPPSIFPEGDPEALSSLERTDPSNGTPKLGQAISGYLSTLPLPEREATARELGRFARWLGTDTTVSQISPVDVSRYQEQFPESSVDINSRLLPVKSFLMSLKSQKLTATNLGAHIRLRRAPTRARALTAREQAEAEPVLVTEEGFTRLQQELDHLEKTVRPDVTESLKNAFADKDFRENAPYDAAKQRLSEVQGRINDIRRTLSAASIYTSDSTETVDLGTTVTLHSLVDDETVVFTIVGPGEVAPREGKISVQSPVGKALVERRPGEVVEVQTPSGALAYRIERIDRIK